MTQNNYYLITIDDIRLSEEYRRKADHIDKVRPDQPMGSMDSVLNQMFNNPNSAHAQKYLR